MALGIDKNYKPAKHNLKIVKGKGQTFEKKLKEGYSHGTKYAVATPEGTEYLPVSPSNRDRKRGGVERYKTGK